MELTENQEVLLEVLRACDEDERAEIFCLYCPNCGKQLHAPKALENRICEDCAFQYDIGVIGE